MNERQQDIIHRAKAQIVRAARDLPAGKRNRVINATERICLTARKAAAPQPRTKKKAVPVSDLDRLDAGQLRALLGYAEETFDETATMLGAVAAWDRKAPYHYDRLLSLVRLAGEQIQSILDTEDALRRAIQAGRI